eukprot:9186364-Karenia_brevis.AAC.1
MMIRGIGVHDGSNGYLGQQWQLVHGKWIGHTLLFTAVDNDENRVVSLGQYIILLEGPFSFGLGIE